MATSIGRENQVDHANQAIKVKDVDVSGNQTIAGTLVVTGTVTSGANVANVISGSGATVTLTAAQTGSLVLFDRAAGIIFTLPAPVVGLRFTFLTTVTITGALAKIITDAGTTLLFGTIFNADTDSANAVAAWTANGTSHIAISGNGTTTGGVKGDWLMLHCITTAGWSVSGMTQGTSTVATPFATS